MNREAEPPLAKIMNDPDVRAMLAFQAGDEESFRILVERHSRALIHWFWFHCRDHELAEDLAQEVWHKVFRACEEYEPRASFRTFLFRIARNHWIDRYRREARRPTERSLDEGVDSDPSGIEGSALSKRIAAEEPAESAGLEREDVARALARAQRRLLRARARDHGFGNGFWSLARLLARSRYPSHPR